jgi:hypothetical protein
MRGWSARRVELRRALHVNDVAACDQHVVLVLSERNSAPTSMLRLLESEPAAPALHGNYGSDRLDDAERCGLRCSSAHRPIIAESPNTSNSVKALWIRNDSLAEDVTRSGLTVEVGRNDVKRLRASSGDDRIEQLRPASWSACNALRRF